jgi:hypothetical protein
MKRMTFIFDCGFSFTAVSPASHTKFHRYIRMRLLACQIEQLGFCYIG